MDLEFFLFLLLTMLASVGVGMLVWVLLVRLFGTVGTTAKIMKYALIPLCIIAYNIFMLSLGNNYYYAAAAPIILLAALVGYLRFAKGGKYMNQPTPMELQQEEFVGAKPDTSKSRRIRERREQRRQEREQQLANSQQKRKKK